MADTASLPRFYYVANFLFRRALALARVRVRVQGQAHVPRSGPLLVVSNHVSFLDPPLIGTFIPRDVVMMSKIENFEGNRLLAWVVRNYGAFPVRRGAGDVSAIRHALRVLKAGRVLYVAPEGTRSRTGALGEPQGGVALLAVRSGAPLLPVGLSGHEEALAHARRLRPTEVCFSIGRPFRLVCPTSRPGHAVLEAMSDAVMERIAAELPPAYRGRFGGERASPFVEEWP